MTHEYGDPLSSDSILVAVARALDLSDKRPCEPLAVQVEQAIHECVCACAVEIEDYIEQRHSGLHAALALEVRCGAERELARRKAEHQQRRIDEASEHSFPASDPPAWIWQETMVQSDAALA